MVLTPSSICSPSALSCAPTQDEAKALVESGVVELNLIAEDTNQVGGRVWVYTLVQRCWQRSRGTVFPAVATCTPDDM
jgi:hypothetical protein